MAADMFLKLGDIKGESTDSKHKDEVEILAWSWSVSNAGSMAVGGGGGKGTADFGDFQFTHSVDAASPNLALACATGQHIKDATFVQRKAGGNQEEFIKFTLSEVFVTNVNPSSSGDDAMEQVTLQAAKVEWAYSAQKSADGTVGSPVFFKYNIKERVKF